MIGEGYPLAVRRNSWGADPVNTVKKHLANRIFQTPVIVFRDVPNHRHTFGIRRPVRVLHIVEHFSGRSAAEGYPRKGAGSSVTTEGHGVKPDCQFPVLRN